MSSDIYVARIEFRGFVFDFDEDFDNPYDCINFIQNFNDFAILNYLFNRICFFIDFRFLGVINFKEDNYIKCFNKTKNRYLDTFDL